MLWAALLIFVGVGFWLVEFGKAAFSADPGFLDVPLIDRVEMFARGEAPAIKRFGQGVGAIAWAFWLEALARILGALKQHNRQQAEA